MDGFCKGWFTDKHEFWPGQALSLEVEKVLHREKTKYQDVVIFQSKQYGRVLVLDDVLQCTERDEFSNQEMMAHIPLCSHPNPKNVLVIGGGTGGMAREIAKHSCVEEIHLCELDKRLVELSKQYLPHLSCGLSDPRVKLHIQDGLEYVAQCKHMFDVIITDPSDPTEDGPCEDFYEQSYYEDIKEALRPEGIHCILADSIWEDMESNKEAMEYSRKMFPVVRLFLTSLPSFPCGNAGYVLSSLNPDTVLEQPLRRLSEAQVEEMGLKYYNPDIHSAAFVLPQFAKKMLYPEV